VALMLPSGACQASSEPASLPLSVHLISFTSCVHLLLALLCCCCRTLSGTPVIIADSQLEIPAQEWQLIAQAANTTRNFAVELASKQGEGVSGWSPLSRYPCTRGWSVG